MTREDVTRECHRREWLLSNTRAAEERIEWLIIRKDNIIYSSLSERPVIGRGESPRDAYLNACEREGVTPF